ncbi:DUF2993 domain-containing protein [Streptomyces luteolifulvus]|uniref:DUF2993 domain-containing protein n=1 Tax=Streptomyces luteolifulvus TaxID=2615112 RepID=A0A6H9UZK6_9ACTN|nr:DUF2993 domain-containing protein [Streptomyces luteolifulvus]
MVAAGLAGPDTAPPRPRRPGARGGEEVIRSVFRRHRTASVTVVTLAVLLLTATAAELAARALLHSRVAATAGRALGADSTVDIDGGPALLDLFDRHLDGVTISSDHATLGRIPDVSVRARLNGIRMTGDRSGTVAGTHADIEVPAASLQALALSHNSRLPVTAVDFDAAADTVTLALGRAGLGRATLRPRLQDGRVALHLQDAEILGTPAPDRVVARIQDALTERTDADYPLGMKATALDVTATGLEIGLDGGPTRLDMPVAVEAR